MNKTYSQSDHKTVFEVRVIGFVKLTLKTLCDKGFTPAQSIRLIAQKDLQIGNSPISWGIAEAILFLYLTINHGSVELAGSLNLFEFYDFEDSDNDRHSG